MIMSFCVQVYLVTKQRVWGPALSCVVLCCVVLCCVVLCCVVLCCVVLCCVVLCCVVLCCVVLCCVVLCCVVLCCVGLGWVVLCCVVLSRRVASRWCVWSDVSVVPSELLSEAVKVLKGFYTVEAIRKFKMDRAIIFCRTKVDCDNMESYLNTVGEGRF